MQKRLLFILPLLLILSCAVSCQREEPDNMDNLLISVRTPLDVTPGFEVKSTFFTGRGPLKTDKILLESLVGGQDYRYSISGLGDDWFTFVIGDTFESGRYDFRIVRGEREKSIGTVVYNFIVDTGLEPADGATVYGIVSCEGEGIGGVQVSDGYNIVVTDKKGVYQLPSKKLNEYVFITVPSGYEAPSVGILPQFYQYTTKLATVPERIDFTLHEAGDQTNHTVLMLGDMHLAGGKQSDRSQFAKFTSEVSKYLSDNPSAKIYGFTLGDMTWDLYWYSRKYCFAEYLADINAIKGMQIFQTIGNHDHDMNATGDWDTALRYKLDLGPNYYSVNIGKVHYIVLDDIQCTNATASTSNGDYRTYMEKVVSDDIAWLKKDLKHVSKSTPVVVMMHAPVYNQNGGASLDNASELVSCFSGYNEVRFVTGHSHKIWNVDKGNVHEHNSGAVCGAWWWAGYYHPTLNLAQDGAFAGYRIMDVKGTSISSYFKSTGRDADVQFRTYDRNALCIKPADYGVTTYASACEDFLKKNGGYNAASSANEVLINVWDYGTGWTVKVTENGTELPVTAAPSYDPLYIATYMMSRFKSSGSFGFGPSQTNHMFKVRASSATSTLEIQVTDDEGRVYTETMKRPKTFSINTYK